MDSSLPSVPAHGTQRRKELTRQYKQADPPVGVYAIRNLADGRTYVGGSMNVQGAMNRARFELQLKGHRNKALQQDWTALGADAFRFEVLQMVRKRDDPAQDWEADLADLLELWREELGCEQPGGYGSEGAAR